jgi:hypothetical protein
LGRQSNINLQKKQKETEEAKETETSKGLPLGLKPCGLRPFTMTSLGIVS